MDRKQLFYTYTNNPGSPNAPAPSAEAEWTDEWGNTYKGTLYLVPKEGEETQAEVLPSHELREALSDLCVGLVKFLSLLLSPPWLYIILLLISVIVVVALVQLIAR